MESVPPTGAGGSIFKSRAECLIQPLTRVVLTAYPPATVWFVCGITA